MKTESKSLIVAESSRFVAQVSNNIVLRLSARVREIEALTRTLSTAVVALPKTGDLLRELVPQLIDFQGDRAIAGGGVWPEPYAFDPYCERYGLFWDRADRGELTYFDDYNHSPEGYHREPWYVVARHLSPGQCCWSASYIDSYSRRPMVTCTAPMWAGDRHLGAVTIDLRLDQLQATVTSWQTSTGGYIFIVDRNNRFITFPEPERVTRHGCNAQGRPTLELIQALELAEVEPTFLPIASVLETVNQELSAAAAKAEATAIATALSTDSPKIDVVEAKLIAAAINRVLPVAANQVWLYKKFEIESDLLLGEACTVFVLNVPSTYWKVVVVKPFSEAAMATYSLVQAEKMASLSRLVGGVAHEINNPIGFIYGNLSFARNYCESLLQLLQLYQQHYPQPPAVIQEFQERYELDFIATDLEQVFQSMQSGADRIRQITQALRGFTRADEAEYKVVNLHDGLESALLLLAEAEPFQEQQRPIQIQREYGELPPVECYAGLLNQVLMNILLNAVEALATYDCPQPTIRIRTWQPRPERVAIAIADNGPGMTEAVRAQIFNPFFSTKAVGQGTGLGLAIGYQTVVAKHGGELTCTSAPGEGSEFYIELPLRLPR